MNKVIAIYLSSLMLAGCVNVVSVRNPFSNEKVEEIYQGTKTATTVALVVSFPQMMSDRPSDYGFKPYNMLTIPCGIVCFADVMLESVVDTVCLPFDIPVSKNRNEKKGNSK